MLHKENIPRQPGNIFFFFGTTRIFPMNQVTRLQLQIVCKIHISFAEVHVVAFCLQNHNGKYNSYFSFFFIEEQV